MRSVIKTPVTRLWFQVLDHLSRRSFRGGHRPPVRVTWKRAFHSGG